MPCYFGGLSDFMTPSLLTKNLNLSLKKSVLSVYEKSARSMKFPILFPNLFFYEVFYPCIDLSMKRPVFEMSYLCNVLSM